MKNVPVQSKLTCKGNIPAKLASVGVDASKLHNYTLSIDADEVPALDTIAEQAADAVLDQVLEAFPAEIWENDAVNGADYVAHWRAQIIADVKATAIGTAVQGRAFKQTVCANNEGCTMEHFSSDGKTTAKKEAVANPFVG